MPDIGLSQVTAKAWKTVQRAIESLAAIVMFLMILQVAANAFARFFLASPIYGTLELSQYWYLPIVALLGFVAAQSRNEHIEADILFAAIPPEAQRWVAAAVQILSAIVAAAFAWFGSIEAIYAFDIGAVAGTTAIIVWPVLMLLPIAFTLFACLCVARAVYEIRVGWTRKDLASLRAESAMERASTIAGGSSDD